MGFYLIERAVSADTSCPPITALASRHGFHPIRSDRIGAWRIHLFHGLDQRTFARIEIDQSTTLMAFGTFLYRGKSGAEGLRLYYEHWKKNGPGWTDSQGHFTLIAIENDTIRLLCDGLGAHKIYHDPQKCLFSNSFLAILSGLETPAFDPLGVYEYAFAGANYGGRSFIGGLGSYPANHLVTLTQTVSDKALASPMSPEPQDPRLPLSDALRLCLTPLRETIGRLIDGAGGHIRLSFSGGYDSRLLLALLMEAGARPELYVYGPDKDVDVKIAHTIAKSENLPIRQVDKRARKEPAPDDMPMILEQALVMFDGWKNTGLFDNGSDIPDRRSRHESGYLPLNGGLGEIYRNFFNLFDRPHRSRDIVNAFYRMYSKSWVSHAFSTKAYRDDMAHAMERQLHCTTDKLNSQQAQMLYPLFRGRFWTAREAEINQRFGPMAFPYLEHSLIRSAAGIPLGLKNNGRLQAAMICAISPTLAAYPTSYGFSFDQPPSLPARIDSLKSRLRPTRFRHHLWAMARRNQKPFAAELSGEHLKAVIDPDLPMMARYFDIGAIDDENCFNRVATLEYLAERFSIKAP